MRVLFDYQIFDCQTVEGISRYHYELIKAWRSVGSLTASLSVKESDNAFLRSDPEFHGSIQPRATQPVWWSRSYPGSYALRQIGLRLGWLSFSALDSPLNRQFSIECLDQQDFDIFHPTYYDPYFLPHLGHKPYVVTVHDMIPRAPQAYLRYNPTHRWKKEVVSRAAHIIAVSEHTKKDVMARLHIPADRISVVYHGSSLSTAAHKRVAPPTHFDLPEHYLLYVGNRGGYKNFRRLIEALAVPLSLRHDLYLLCIGGGRLTRTEENFLTRAGVRQKVRQRTVDEVDLGMAYERAIALVFPSLYEGFGLPIIEAMSCDCPVAVSNASCFPEIARDAAAYFDPASVLSIRSTLQRLLDQPRLREQLRRRGRQRVADFSWEKAAQQTQAVYEHVLAQVGLPPAHRPRSFSGIGG